jgi:hypothetical protein
VIINANVVASLKPAAILPSSCQVGIRRGCWDHRCCSGRDAGTATLPWQSTSSGDHTSEGASHPAESSALWSPAPRKGCWDRHAAVTQHEHREITNSEGTSHAAESPTLWSPAPRKGCWDRHAAVTQHEQREITPVRGPAIQLSPLHCGRQRPGRDAGTATLP